MTMVEPVMQRKHPILPCTLRDSPRTYDESTALNPGGGGGGGGREREREEGTSVEAKTKVKTDYGNVQTYKPPTNPHTHTFVGKCTSTHPYDDTIPSSYYLTDLLQQVNLIIIQMVE